MQAEPVVLDTNIVLDLLVFRDAAAQPIRAALDAGRWQWLATRPMRDELARVLGYRRVAPRVAYYQLQPGEVLAAFDRQALIVDVPPKAPVTCADADDQGFIDLAVARRARLFSKDQAVLSMRKRLAPLGVLAARAPQPETLPGADAVAPGPGAAVIPSGPGPNPDAATRGANA